MLKFVRASCTNIRRRVALLLAGISLILLGLIAAIIYEGYEDYGEILGPSSELHAWLSSNPNRFSQDAYEMAISLQDLQVSVLQRHSKAAANIKDLPTALALVRGKFAHFSTDFVAGQAFAKYESYPDAMHSVQHYVSSVESYAKGATTLDQVTVAYQEAMENFLLLKSDALLQDYARMDGLTNGVASFARVSKEGLIALYVLMVMNIISLSAAFVLGWKSMSEADARRESVKWLVETLGHDLRSPLQSIQSANALMAQASNEEDRRKYAAIVKTSTRSLGRLIDDIVQVVRSEKLSYEPQIESVPRWLDSMSARYRMKAEQKGLQFYCTSDYSDCRYAEFDVERLNQCVGNVLTNAIKYTQVGTICLNVKVVQREGPSGYELVVDVTDTGPGIPKEDRKRVLEPFFRGSNVVQVAGMGLGLSIVSKFIESQNGTLKIESPDVGGCKVHMTIPLKGATAEQLSRLAEQWNSSVERPNLARMEREVLVVNDDEKIQNSIGNLLREAGYAVEVVATGLAALQILHAGGFKVVLSELQMAQMDGSELARKCMSLHPRPYFIAITETPSELDAPDGERIFDEILHRPVDENDLLDSIERGLQQSVGADAQQKAN